MMDSDNKKKARFCVPGSVLKPIRNLLLAVVVLFVSANYAPAQTADSAKEPSKRSTSADSQKQDPIGITMSDPIEETWEFGVKINCVGQGKQIAVIGPVPMDWPEQEIEVIEEVKTENISRLKFNNVSKHARQFAFGINRMGAGQTAQAIVKVKVKKRIIYAPDDTTQFSIAKKVPSAARTYLKPSPFIESKHKRIKEIAKSLKPDGLTDWEYVESILKWVRENIEYKFDVVNHSCLHALDNKHGDCEELSALFIAICRAKGIPARAVWIPGHTYPEFFLQDKDGNGHWFPCQAAGTYEFGSMTETKPILQKGDRFKLPGSRQEIRYLRPTLTAMDGQGLSIEWIAREAKPEK